MNTQRGMPPVMSDNQNPHRIADDAKKEMVREARQVDAAKIALANGKRFGLFCRLQHEAAQLSIEIIRQLRAGDSLVIFHDGANIGVNLRMQD